MSFASMLRGLTSAEVRFVVVGGLAGAAHGSGRITDDLDVCYDLATDNVERLAALLSGWDAYPRGTEPGLPFFMDLRQFRTTPVMTLTTSEGYLDVLDRIVGVGGYCEARAQSAEFTGFDVTFRVLDLPALIAAKRATGRRKDADHLPELEALLAYRERSASNDGGKGSL